MNTEKLHAIVKAIRADFDESGVLPDLNNLVSNLQNLINQPNQPQYQQSVSKLRQKLAESLLNSKVNNFSPTWKQVVSEIGGSELLGYPVSVEIDSIFSENQITPSVALSELRELASKIEFFLKSIEGIDDAFNDLRIGSEELDPGECEIGVLIPRSFVDNKLKNFGDEIEELNKIFGVFSELVTGGRPGFEIRAIASSDLSIYLLSQAPTCAAIAVAIERIVALYKSLLEIKKLRSDLVKQGLGEESLKGVEDHANGVVANGIDKLISDLEEKFTTSIDSGRKNELTIELRYSLKKIANRIDRGFNIEVRMAEPKIEKDGESDAADGVTRSYEEIRKASQNMQFINSTGQPILQLSESDEYATNEGSPQHAKGDDAKGDGRN